MTDCTPLSSDVGRPDSPNTVLDQIFSTYCQAFAALSKKAMKLGNPQEPKPKRKKLLKLNVSKPTFRQYPASQMPPVVSQSPPRRDITILSPEFSVPPPNSLRKRNAMKFAQPQPKRTRIENDDTSSSSSDCVPVPKVVPIPRAHEDDNKPVQKVLEDIAKIANLVGQPVVKPYKLPF
uniref:HUN domain-containing protein n=1 Tax=Steinernema glaseri TaxID=37863 RepID=A0A1I8A471_9BILA